MATACARVRAPSLAFALRTCVCTVAGRELEHLRDLLVGGACGQQGEHLALARGRAAAGEARHVCSAARLRVGRRLPGASTSPGVDSVAERISRWRPGSTLAATLMWTSCASPPAS